MTERDAEAEVERSEPRHFWFEGEVDRELLAKFNKKYAIEPLDIRRAEEKESDYPGEFGVVQGLQDCLGELMVALKAAERGMEYYKHVADELRKELATIYAERDELRKEVERLDVSRWFLTQL